MSTPWPEERIEELKSLWHGGMSAGLIADKMRGGLTRSAVMGKLHRLGLKRDDPKAIRIKIRHKRLAATHIRPPVDFRRKPLSDIAPPEPAPAAIPEPSAAHRCGILGLSNASCRWPVTDGSPFLFCAEPDADFANGRPYCKFHSILATRGHNAEVG